MELESFDMLMEMFMKANERMIRLMAKANTFKLMELYMTVNEKMIYKKATAKKHESTTASMKDFT